MRKELVGPRERLYDNLIKNRKSCHLCKSDLCNPSLLEGYGKYDTEIGPWSRWQGNLYADLMVVGQDWGSVEYLRNNYLGKPYEVKSNATNKNLRDLLKNSVGTNRFEVAW